MPIDQASRVQVTSMPTAAMPPGSIQHALGLHLYQPAGNLRSLLKQDEAEVARILKCYERIGRHAHKYAHVARLHLALSPVLLEQLRDPELIEACRHLADLPAIVDGLRSAAGIEFVGTGYRHAPLPLVPPADWEEQLRNERVAVEALLGRVLKGYWPPAGLFTLEMVPVLVRAGYEYVLLPHGGLAMPDGSGVDPYRPYRLSHQGARIAVVPIDGGFSHAQEVGLEASWFADEVRNGVAQAPHADSPYLVTTWSDGENGEWFRRLDEEHGFFGQYFSPYMEFCETGEFPVRPVQLSEYLRTNRPSVEVSLRTDLATEALAVGHEEVTNRAARNRLFRSSARYWALARGGTPPAAPRLALPKARELILRAEDSGLLLGDAAQRTVMLGLLDEADRLLDPNASPVGQPGTIPAVTAQAVPSRDPAVAAAGKPAVASPQEPAAEKPQAAAVETPMEPPAAARPAATTVVRPKETAVEKPRERAAAEPKEPAIEQPREPIAGQPTHRAFAKPKGSGKRSAGKTRPKHKR